MDPTETEEFKADPPQEITSNGNLMVQLSDGTYLLIPDSLGFIKDYDGKAMMIDDNYHIWILKPSIKKGMTKWICVTEED